VYEPTPCACAGGVAKERETYAASAGLAITSEVSNCGARPPEGYCLSSGWGGRVVCTRDIFILNEIWAQHKTYFGKHFAWKTCFTYHLVTVLAPKYKRHILTTKLRKVCYSLP
jgi:hypothetical protein